MVEFQGQRPLTLCRKVNALSSVRGWRFQARGKCEAPKARTWFAASCLSAGKGENRKYRDTDHRELRFSDEWLTTSRAEEARGLPGARKNVMKSRLPLLLAAILETACLAAWAVYQRRARRKPPAERSLIKPAWLYWSWRAFASVIYVGIALCLWQAFNTGQPEYFLLMLVASPLFLATVVGFTTAGVFGFDYSVFGKHRRRPLPNEAPLFEVRASSARIAKARFSQPLVTWALFSQGIGIKLWSVGDVFVPRDEIESLEIRGGFLGMMSELTHHCPEVRGPVGVPNRVAEMMAQCYPEKVLGHSQSGAGATFDMS